MKYHVFVATTQGLVAIQTITAIDDAQISSIVSINGTSTTANISNAYHNFVKKGAGIIEQDFGQCSYRVNLSERIDYGNSWQLAFYLAHSIAQQGLLGDGEVNVGDQVICATGEINTSSRKVQRVEQVALKQNLAAEKIHQWQLMGNDVCFLVPADNQGDIDAKLNLNIKPVMQLDQALSVLPVFAASPSQADSGAISRQHTPTKLTAALPLTTGIKRFIRHSFSLKRALSMTGCLVVLALAGWQIKAYLSAPKIISPAMPATAQQQHIAQVSGLARANPIADLPDEQINMMAYFAKYLDCQDENIQHKVSKEGAVFLGTKLVNLCQLTLEAPGSITAVLLVAADSRAILQLSKENEQWQIPMPKKQSANRHYYLILMSDSSPHRAKNLKAHLTRQTLPGLVKLSDIQQWLNSNHWQAKIVSHSLHSY